MAAHDWVAVYNNTSSVEAVVKTSENQYQPYWGNNNNSNNSNTYILRCSKINREDVFPIIKCQSNKSSAW